MSILFLYAHSKKQEILKNNIDILNKFYPLKKLKNVILEL